MSEWYGSKEHTEAIEHVLRRGYAGRLSAFGPCEGYVYIIFTRGGEFMKVGFTKTDPRLRMASLQTGNHLHLRLGSLFPGCRNMERALHQRLAEFRASGEWFRHPPEVQAIVENFIDYRAGWPD